MKRKFYILCTMTWLLLLAAFVLAVNESKLAVPCILAAAGCYIWFNKVREVYHPDL